MKKHLLLTLFTLTSLVLNAQSNDQNNMGKKRNPENGYRGIVDCGYQIGVGKFGLDRVKLNVVNGYHVGSDLSFGFGTGVRYYPRQKAILVPFFIDCKLYLTDNKFAPYLSFGMGYSFDATNSFKATGFLFNPSAGVKFKLANNSALSLGVEYDMQSMNFVRMENNANVITYGNSGSAGVVVGFLF